MRRTRAILSAVLPWAIHVLCVGGMARRMAAPFMAACGLFSVAWTLVTEPWSVTALTSPGEALLFTGVLSVGVGFTAQVVAQRHANAADAVVILSSETLFAGLLGYLLPGDRPSTAGSLGRL